VVSRVPGDSGEASAAWAVQAEELEGGAVGSVLVCVVDDVCCCCAQFEVPQQG
jgi:hypothetical protein